MQFNDLIFNEMQNIDLDPMANEYVMDYIYPKIKAQEKDKQDIEVWFIPNNSLLYQGVMEWYGNKDRALKHIRSVVEDEDGLYFASDVNHNLIETVSADLLGSRFANENAKKLFIKMLNAR